MDHRIVFAPARPVARAFAVALATTHARRFVAASAALAQAPAPAPKAAPKRAKAAPKARPQRRRRAAGAGCRRSNGGAEQPQLIFSPWTKFCLKGQEAERQAGLLHRQGRPRRIRACRWSPPC